MNLEWECTVSLLWVTKLEELRPPVCHPQIFVSTFQETTLYGCTVRINEPVGVIGIACPDEFPLLAFVSLFAPAVVRGNTMVIIPSEKYPFSATDLYQVWS